MTGSPPAAPAVRRHAHRPAPAGAGRRWLTSAAPWLAALGVAAVAWLIRAIGITTNYDIFIDEITYTRIADNLATGKGLTLYGAPFDLHPPAGVGLYALAIKVFGLHGSLTDVLFGLRPFVALLGALTCAVVFLLTARLTNCRIGLAAAAVVALDPFEIFFDSRVMLEAPAQLASALSILLLAWAAGCASRRRSWVLVVGAGLAAGFAICAKEYFGLVLGLTLLLCLVTGRVVARKKAATVLGIMAGCYLLAESLVIATTGFGPWRNQVGNGLLRLIGREQITGFNSATVHVSLLSRVAADAPHFSATYLVLGCGVVASVVQVLALLRRRSARSVGDGQPGKDNGRILVTFWSIAATAYLGYATLFGTLEEQMYYLLLVPGVCALGGLAYQALPRLAGHWKKIAVAVAGAVLVANAAVWVAVHRTPDNEYRQLLSWAPAHIPAGSTVSVTDGTTQFLLNGVVFSQAVTVPAIIKDHVDYVLVNTDLVEQGYPTATPPFARYLRDHATVVFRASGPSDGSLIMYDVRAITGAR